MPIYSKVRCPQMRQVLMFAFEELADKQIHINKWINHHRQDCFWYGLKYCIEALEDTVNFAHTSVEEQIDYVLVDHNEANIIKPVINTLDIVCNQIGYEQPDTAYINSPLWDDVVNSAKAAFDVFMANEEKARQINPHSWNGEDDWPNVKPEDNVKL